MQLPFALVKPVVAWRPIVKPYRVMHVDSVDWSSLHADLERATCIAYDFETRGVDTFRPETRAVGLALSYTAMDTSVWSDPKKWNALSVSYGYIDAADAGEAGSHKLAELVRHIGELRRRTGCHVVAHNVMFDEAVARMHLRRAGTYTSRLDGNGLTASHCTFILYKQVASEGWPGQQWGLKAAMRDVLGWTDTNERGIDDWLVAHGFHSTGPSRAEGEAPEVHLAKVRAWELVPKKGGGERSKVAADHSEMWRVPPLTLGEYACLDAVSCLQLYSRVLHPLCTQFQALDSYHSNHYLHLVHLLVDQQWHGIRVDRPALEVRLASLLAEVERADAGIRTHPAVSDWIARREASLLTPLAQSEPPRHKKQRTRKEPAKYTKQGAESKNWLKWFSLSEQPPVESIRWQNWNSKWQLAASGSDPDYKVSLTSTTTIRTLLFGSGDEAGLLLWEWGEEPDAERRSPGTIWVTGRFGRVELSRTDSGLQPIDEDCISQLEDEQLRGLLLTHGGATKEAQFCTSYLSLLVLHSDPDAHWRIHPGWVAHGTKTGRLSGKAPSLQQVPKSLQFLDCFVADPGTQWVEQDWSAVEPHVLAELSRDEGLLQLYGPDANPANDRYLFSAFMFPGEMGSRVQAVYDRAEPTDAMVSKAKKEVGDVRTLAKTVVLAMDYGGGARKIQRSMAAGGNSLDLEVVAEMVAAQRETHRGVFVDYNRQLSNEWTLRGGWLLSGLGFPTPVYEKYKKDLISRQVQRTAHDCHVLYMSEYTRRLCAEGIEFRDIVADFHDQFIRSVAEEDAQRALEIARETVKWLNAELQMYVRLKAEPKLCLSLSHAKMEEKWEARESARKMQS